MSHGLPKRIRFAFVTQALLASAAMLVGIVLVGGYARNALVERWLEAEAAAFWDSGADGAARMQPGTATIRGWFVPAGSDGSTLPPELHDLAPGHATLADSSQHVLRSRHRDGDLYLWMSTQQIDRTVLLACLALMLFGLFAIVAITWFTYRRSRRIVLPIHRLADVVAQWDPADWDAAMPIVLPYPLTADTSREMRALSTALGGLAARIADFVQRERDFTRDASHELRTPLTIIRVATDMTLGDPAVPPHIQRSLQRIRHAAQDLEAMVEAFLILARERGIAPQSEEFDVREVVADEVEKVRPMLAAKPVELHVAGDASPRLVAPPRVFGVMLGHLLRNACTFTDAGRIDVEVDRDEVRVRDTGIGMSDDTLQHACDPFFRADQFNPVGKGIGLTIVRRLGDRFGWPVVLESTPGKGTVATIRFSIPSIA